MYERINLKKYVGIVPVDTGQRNYNTRNCNNLSLPLVRTTLAAKSFIVLATKIWNNLPPHLKSINSLHKFKKDLKLHHLSNF